MAILVDSQSMNSTADIDVISSFLAIFKQFKIFEKSLEASRQTCLFIGYGGQKIAASVMKPCKISQIILILTSVPSAPMNSCFKS